MNAENDEVYKYVLKTRIYYVISIRSSLYEKPRKNNHVIFHLLTCLLVHPSTVNINGPFAWGKDIEKLMLGTYMSCVYQPARGEESTVAVRCAPRCSLLTSERQPRSWLVVEPSARRLAGHQCMMWLLAHCTLQCSRTNSSCCL